MNYCATEYDEYSNAGDHDLRSCYSTIQAYFAGKFWRSKFEEDETSRDFTKILSDWLHDTSFLGAPDLFNRKTIQWNILNGCEKLC